MNSFKRLQNAVIVGIVFIFLVIVFSALAHLILSDIKEGIERINKYGLKSIVVNIWEGENGE